MSAERQASELTVAILPMGDVSPWQITLTAEVLKQEFGVKTIILPGIEIPSACFNAELGQYQQNALLDFLFLQMPANTQRIVGIVTEKLADRTNKLCHGIADLYDGAVAYREPCFSGYGYELIKSQIDKDMLSYHLITHEFAHTLGINHCENQDCAMHRATQSTALCDSCQCWVDRELQVEPGSGEERFARAESLYRHDQLNQAIVAYQEAVAHSPREPLYYHGLSSALYKAGQLSEGRKNLTLSIAFSNDYPDFYYNFGLKNLRRNLGIAEGFFYKAIGIAKNPQKMQRLVGQAYREILHDVERASRHYKEYLRMGGDDRDVIEWMASRSQLLLH